MPIPTGSGRQRLNVLGAIAYGSCQFHSVINTGAIATQQVCDRLRQLRTAHRKPLTVILDNARYQRNKTVMALASNLDIELLFLPTYSLNLNLIERVWKVVKS
jgi:transposase